MIKTIMFIKIIVHIHIDGLVQDCSNSSALAMELLQFCPKSSGYCYGDFRQAASLTFVC